MVKLDLANHNSMMYGRFSIMKTFFFLKLSAHGLLSNIPISWSDKRIEQKTSSEHEKLDPLFN